MYLSISTEEGLGTTMGAEVFLPLIVTLLLGLLFAHTHRHAFAGGHLETFAFLEG